MKTLYKVTLFLPTGSRRMTYIRYFETKKEAKEYQEKYIIEHGNNSSLYEIEVVKVLD